MSKLPTGDRGQRYEIRANGYPKEGDSVFGWSEGLDTAHCMYEAVLLAPGCKGAQIWDRKEGKPVMSS